MDMVGHMLYLLKHAKLSTGNAAKTNLTGGGFEAELHGARFFSRR
jgi:hypothetical protein